MIGWVWQPLVPLARDYMYRMPTYLVRMLLGIIYEKHWAAQLEQFSICILCLMRH